MSRVEIWHGRLLRAIEFHRFEVYHPEAYGPEGPIWSCTGSCALDIARRYEDPRLMELTDAEEAAEAATWDLKCCRCGDEPRHLDSFLCRWCSADGGTEREWKKAQELYRHVREQREYLVEVCGWTGGWLARHVEGAPV